MIQTVTCSVLSSLLPRLKHVSDRERGNLRFPGHSTHEEGSKVAMGGGGWAGDVPMSPADSPTLLEIINRQPGGVGLRDSVLEKGGQQGSP